MVAARPEELAAFEVMRRVRGLEVVPAVDGSAPRMVDGTYTDPRDGAPGADEVTTAATTDGMRLERMLLEPRHIPGASWAWLLTDCEELHPRDYQRHVEPLALLCEGHGVTDPAELPACVDSPALRWYRANGVRLRGTSDTRTPGALHGAPAVVGGFVSPSLGALPAWLATTLRESEVLRSHVEKLERHPADHRHLFLRLHDSGVPGNLSVSMHPEPGREGELPDSEPLVSPGIEAVWVCPRFRGERLMLWERGAGWSSHMPWD